MNIDNRNLRSFLAHRGFTADVFIPRNADRAKGYAFAQFDTSETARTAIDALNGSEFEGRRLVLRPANPRNVS
jgi:RNA recognition motif-containing protein